MPRRHRSACTGALLAGYVTLFVALSAGIGELVSDRLTENNRADARLLALRLAALPPDEAALRQRLAAQFSTGAYRHLALTGPDQALVFNERRAPLADDAGGLAAGWFPPRAAPGRATVRHYGVGPRTLIVERQPGPGLELHRSLLGSLGAALGAGLAVTGLVGVVLARRSPPGAAPARSHAATDRDGAPEPAPGPGRDALTGLLARDAFLARLAATLGDGESAGCLALLRIDHLAALNHSHGRHVVDAALAAIGHSLRHWHPDEGELIGARLNGSEFAVLAPTARDPGRLGTTLRWRVAQTVRRHGFDEAPALPTAATPCAAGDTIPALLTRLDSALAREPGQVARPAVVADADRDIERPGRREARAWRERLESALAQDAFHLEPFPVVDSAGYLLHDEAVLCLADEDRCHLGAQITAWGERLSLNGAIDRCTVTLAARRCREGAGDFSIGLSPTALADATFAAWLRSQLAALGGAAERIAVEIDAAAAIDNADGFATLRRAVHDSGAGIGLRHVGLQLAQLNEIDRLLPDYIKIDPLYVRDIAAAPARRRVLETLAALARSLATPCVAEGVASREERDAAFACGVAAVTGPGAIVKRSAGKDARSQQQIG